VRDCQRETVSAAFGEEGTVTDPELPFGAAVVIEPYPVSAGYTEPTTSRDAALSIDAASLRAQVLAALVGLALTPDECAERMGLSVLSVRPRFTELARLGLIERTDEKRTNTSGRKAWVYRSV
jgi:hypothetical protein